MTSRALAFVLLAALAATLVGCGSSGGTKQPTIQKALQFQIADLKPSRPIGAGQPTAVSFKILQPQNGRLVTMTRFRRGSGPHTGVHMIIVRRDLGFIIHRHPPIGPDGTFAQTITFPAPGPYRMVLDVYPPLSTSGVEAQTNFQLFAAFHVAGAYHPQPLPQPSTAETVDGYHFDIAKIDPSPLRAIQPSFMTIAVTDPSGKPVTFRPWYGALAHAIFFQQGTLNYFHTHVCSPGARGCTSVFGAKRVTGSSATPGRMNVGVLLPLPGTWRLFLQLQAKGKVLTAPFTLHVR